MPQKSRTAGGPLMAGYWTPGEYTNDEIMTNHTKAAPAILLNIPELENQNSINIHTTNSTIIQIYVTADKNPTSDISTIRDNWVPIQGDTEYTITKNEPITIQNTAWRQCVILAWPTDNTSTHTVSVWAATYRTI